MIRWRYLWFRHIREDERLCHLHDCTVYRSQLLCYPADLVLRYSAVPEDGKSDIQIWVLLGIVLCFAIVSRDIGRLFCRVSVDPITGQGVLPSLLPALLGFPAFVLNPIGGSVAEMRSALMKISKDCRHRVLPHLYLAANSKAVASSSSSEMI